LDVLQEVAVVVVVVVQSIDLLVRQVLVYY
jgi:hypothetical protein